jgi:hypothetical protein
MAGGQRSGYQQSDLRHPERLFPDKTAGQQQLSDNNQRTIQGTPTTNENKMDKKPPGWENVILESNTRRKTEC